MEDKVMTSTTFQSDLTSIFGCIASFEVSIVNIQGENFLKKKLPVFVLEVEY
jgi:hypothetical protein